MRALDDAKTPNTARRGTGRREKGPEYQAAHAFADKNEQ